MAETKQPTGPEEQAGAVAQDAPPGMTTGEQTEMPGMDGPAPALTVDEALMLEQEGQAALYEMGEALPDPGEVVVDFTKINDLMAERRAAERATVEEQEVEAAAAGGDKAEPEQPPTGEQTADAPKARRGRPPKAEKSGPEAEKTDKPRKGRPPKQDKAAKPPRDKVSRSDKDKPGEDKGGGGGPVSGPAVSVPEHPAEPAPPPRPVEEGKVVYLKLSELNPFHTFRAHPFKVQDDAAMQDLVATIKEHGVMTPATVRPEKDGSGYEIIAGHRRHHGSELAGLDELPCIVRDMTDIEAVREMKNSNKQRGDPLPSELARLLDLEVEAIKHQGGRLDNVAEGDRGKRSVEIVGENNGMNYKKVMRYIRLNSLVPELLNMVDEKKLGFMPAVELSYIRPKNQRLVAVSIDGEQSSPSVAQAKRLRELDQQGKLNGDIIDGILSEQKKEDKGVIISTAELEKYFGKEVTPAKMKEQIMSLLDDWKEKQPPELGKADKKKTDMEK